MRELDVHEVARGVRSGGRRGPVRTRRRVTRPAVRPDGCHPGAPVATAAAVRSPRAVRAVPESDTGSRRGAVCARGALPGGPAVLPRGPVPAPGGDASVARAARTGRCGGLDGDVQVRVPARAIRPASRRCLVAVGRRRGRSGARPRGERLLAGAAAVLCSATVVLLLGLLGDAAAGWNAGSVEPSAGPVPVQVVDH